MAMWQIAVIAIGVLFVAALFWARANEQKQKAVR